MTLKELQNTVDEWIKTHGVRYFDELTNTVVLMEEIGEFSRLIARVYGEQSFKKEIDEKNAKENIKNELGDILFVVTCLANQMELDIEEIMKSNIDKKTKRDHKRHHDNSKLKSL